MAGCATAPSEPLVAAVVRCGTVATYPPGTMQKAAAEIETLPADSAVGAILIPDLGRMRDEARACAKQTTSKPPASS